MPMLHLNQIRFYSLMLVVGVVTGCGAIFFRELIGLLHNLLFYGQLSSHYDVLQHAAPSRWGAGIVLVPVLAAVIVAFLIKNYAPEARGTGVPAVIYAVYYENERIRPMAGIIKALASSLSIGSGGSIGREGPIIQMGGALGSALGEAFKLADWQRMTLIACGASGGIAAMFNTPMGGLLFAIEILLPEISARTIIPVSIATAVSTYMTYFLYGDVPLIPVDASVIAHISAYTAVSYSFLGMIVGLAAAFFIRGIYLIEEAFEKLPDNYYFRHMAGMFLVGLSMYFMLKVFGHYYIQGLGYATIMDVMTSTLTDPYFLIFLAALKLLSTGLTLGSGGSGGIFSPLLFIGAALGGGFAEVYKLVFPGEMSMNLQLGAVAGMAGMVGASTGAPLTAIIMTAELTNDMRIVLPLMMMVAIAYGVRRTLIKESIYTYRLTRKGSHVPDTWRSQPL
ncbi:H(+)/Cl(-) exchange transporter ClcA [Aquicella siphonis]|uniref:H(+)/Cl(-) exchange transporter ClcA n=1 Tax=Aquicella siphonis TaxID=254247 RepID=A0A5E4PJI0_9COXI|nr:chloride channel protein [Aquicella siphonis]VVC77124.1 H(+)/Cl(-) exchange transporter ClcA [Aquicella siphonis]